MATAQQIFTKSLKLLYVLEAGGTPSANDLTDGLEALQDMLDAWSADDIMIPYITTENYTLTIGQNSYTYGTGGNFNASRPVEITAAYLRDSSGLDVPLEILNQEKYNAITDKDLSAKPTGIYYVPSYPTGTVYFNCDPDAAYTLYVDTLKPLTQPSVIGDNVNFQPGYKDLMTYNLALRIAPMYQVSVSHEVALIANNLMNAIERKNLRVPVLTPDFPVSGSFNINTG